MALGSEVCLMGWEQGSAAENRLYIQNIPSSVPDPLLQSLFLWGQAVSAHASLTSCVIRKQLAPMEYTLQVEGKYRLSPA